MRPFLTARWSNLALISYAVPDAVLQPYLPPGLALDRREGQAFASLVAFDFLKTRVLGVPWPGFVNFPEINLRFYVREGQQRGVVFVREFVPSRVVAGMARLLYNEPYRATRMRSEVQTSGERIEVSHEFWWGGQAQRLRVTGQLPTVLPGEESTEHFFKEHQWGYGVDHWGRLLRYEVTHAHWQVYQQPVAQLEVDFGRLYGPQWRFLNEQAPASVVLAVGSGVEVYPGRAVVVRENA
jgi:uncharacterized protein YqjF (DUF2071 family)